MKRVAAFLVFAAAAFGQPFVYYRGAVNAASFLPPGLPNGAIARGSMFSIFGRSLGPASAQQVSAFPLQPTFGGVSVELTQGTTKVNALPVYVSPSQLNVILPSNTPLGAVSLRVIYNAQSSNPIPINVAPTSIGLFSVNGGGFGPGIVQNFVAQASQPINSLSATARPGQTEILWGTGIGAATFSDAVAPTAVTLDSTLELFVGGKKAAIAYAGRTPCCASIDQIVFTVPADAPSGCYVPLVARSRGVVVSNTVTMSIHPSGASCTDAHNPLSAQFRAGGNTAIAHLVRDTLHVDQGTSRPEDLVSDALLATFRNFSPSEFYFNAFTALPPLGTCTTYSGATARMLSANSPFAPSGPQINVSALSVEAGSASTSATNAPSFEGSFLALLGQQGQGSTAPAPVLNSGPFTLSGPGFRAILDSVNPVNWTNREQSATIDRTQDMTLTWSGTPGNGRGVMIVGMSDRVPDNALGSFVCLAPAGATSFTVPSYVLAALPRSADGQYSVSAQLSIGNVPLSSAVSLPGWTHSFLGVSSWTSRSAVTK